MELWMAGVAVSWLFGYSVLNIVALRLSFLEKVGLAYPVGLMLQTLVMLGMDSMGLGLASMRVIWVSLMFIAALNAVLWFRRQEVGEVWREWCATCRRLPDVNLVWLLFMGLTVYLEYMNWTKCMFFPTFDRDSITSFDTIGWIVAQEQTFKGVSIFRNDYIQQLTGSGLVSTYMPLVQLSYAYVYGLGADISKIVPAMMYASFLVAFYGVVRRSAGHTAASAAVFFTLITPEMLAWSSLSITNVIHAAYASLGVAYTVLWLQKGDRKFFAVASLLTAGGLWARNESLVFVMTSILFVFLYKWMEIRQRTVSPRKAWGAVASYAVLIVSPLLIWTVFMKVNGIYAYADNIIHILPLWDVAKAETIVRYFFSHFTNTNFYGLTFPLFFFVLLANIPNLIPYKRSKPLPPSRSKSRIKASEALPVPAWYKEALLPGLTVLSLLIYMALLYQIEYKWDTIENVLSYSAKRFLFSFVPLLWLYVVSNRYMRRFFLWVDESLSFRRADCKRV
jgi:hypothetical protein